MRKKRGKSIRANILHTIVRSVTWLEEDSNGFKKLCNISLLEWVYTFPCNEVPLWTNKPLEYGFARFWVITATNILFVHDDKVFCNAARSFSLFFIHSELLFFSIPKGSEASLFAIPFSICRMISHFEPKSYLPIFNLLLSFWFFFCTYWNKERDGANWNHLERAGMS